MAELHTMFMTNTRDLDIDMKDVKRYLGAKELDPAIKKIMDECIGCVYSVAAPKAVYAKVNIKVGRESVDFGFVKVKSQNLAAHLAGCNEAFVIATTLGIGIDRTIEKYIRILQTKAAVCNAISSALIESFCDNINKFLITKKESVSRFSPGYGDFDISYQKPILEFLDANRKIGVTLTDSFMMVPSKSVTAIIGLKK